MEDSIVIQLLKRGHLAFIPVKPIASARILPYTILLYPLMIRLSLLDGAVSGQLLIISGLSNSLKIASNSSLAK